MALNIISMLDKKQYEEYKSTLMELYQKTLTVLEKNDPEEYEVNLVLMDEKMIHQYNRDFRSMDRPTDVLSFEDGSEVEGKILLGDIMISTDHVKRQSEEYGHSEKRELCFLFVHGLLHLLGYDHQTKEEEVRMFSLQESLLEGVAERNEAK